MPVLPAPGLAVANVRSCLLARSLAGSRAAPRRCRRPPRSPRAHPWSPARPDSLTALLELAGQDHLGAPARSRGTTPAAFSASEVDRRRPASFARSDRRTSAVSLARQRDEAALGQAALQRHLAAFEADLVEAAGARTSGPCGRGPRSCPSPSRCRGRRACARCLAPGAGLIVLSCMLSPRHFTR